MLGRSAISSMPKLHKLLDSNMWMFISANEDIEQKHRKNFLQFLKNQRNQNPRKTPLKLFWFWHTLAIFCVIFFTVGGGNSVAPFQLSISITVEGFKFNCKLCACATFPSVYVSVCQGQNASEWIIANQKIWPVVIFLMCNFHQIFDIGECASHSQCWCSALEQVTMMPFVYDQTLLNVGHLISFTDIQLLNIWIIQMLHIVTMKKCHSNEADLTHPNGFH